MPRRSRRSEPSPGRRGRPAPPIDTAAIRTRLLGPEWAHVEGFQVRQTRGEKQYRCPYCEQWVQPGTVHIVAFPDGRPEDRRHYHTPCWERHSGTRRPQP
jgi:hypothetical protein